LSDEYFRLMRRVVEEAARLEMKIILYDEGSYPSGTANGAVVAQNPDFTSLVLGKQPGGEHQLELRITNSMANAYEGVQSPSGLIGPVNLIYST
jgi:hypothetical protein